MPQINNNASNANNFVQRFERAKRQHENFERLQQHRAQMSPAERQRYDEVLEKLRSLQAQSNNPGGGMMGPLSAMGGGPRVGGILGAMGGIGLPPVVGTSRRAD